MGYELDKLMRSFGVSTASLLPYAGEESRPRRPGADATPEQIRKYNDDMAQYLADKSAYDQYADQYRERVSSGSPYTQAQYQPTRRTPAPETMAQQATAREVPWDETPITLGARPPVNYVSSQAPTWDSQISAPRYGQPAPASTGLQGATEAAGPRASDPYYRAIKKYLEDHTAEETKQYFGASDYDLQRARAYVPPTNEWTPGFVGPHEDISGLLPTTITETLYGDVPPIQPTFPGINALGPPNQNTGTTAPPDNAISIEQARNALAQAGTAYGNMPGATVRGPQEMANLLQVPVTRGETTFTPTPLAEGEAALAVEPPQIPSSPLTIEQARTFLTNRNIPFGNQEGAVVRGPQAMADYFRTPIVRGGRTFLPGQAHRIEPPGAYGPLAGRGGAPAAVVAANRPRPVTPGMPAGALATAGQAASRQPAAQPARQTPTPPSRFNPLNFSADALENIRRLTGTRFAEGGPVRMQEGGFMDNQYIMAPRDEESSNEASLRDMLEAYQSAMGPNSYAEDIKAAREKASAQQEELLKSLQGAAGGGDSSKAEMYFRLAAALGQPTRTGTFGETIGNVGQAMAESAKAGRERQMAQRQLALEAQKIRAAGAKEDLNTLVEQAKEESSGRRLLAGELLKSKLAEPSEEKKFEIQARLADAAERRAVAAEQTAAAAVARAENAANALTPGEREEEKARGKLNFSFPKESAALELGTHGLQSQINTIDKLLEEKEGLSGITGVQGAVYQNLPDPIKAMSGPRAKAFSLYTQISNRSILDELSKMRMESPHGGALGQVTEREEEMLRRAASAMDLAKNTEDFVKAAEAYKDNLEFVKKNMQRRFFDSYAYKPETELKTVTERLRDVEATGARAPKAASQQQEALDWANANPDDPRSAQIKQRLGVQ